MSDSINPDHYKRLPAEAIEIIESAIEDAPTNTEAYLQGQALKYLLRCWHKAGREDVVKAQWYLNRMVQSFMLPENPLDGIDSPKPAFAVGDKVKFCGADNYHWLNGKIGLVTLIEGNRFYVTRPGGYGWFYPSELQPVEGQK